VLQGNRFHDCIDCDFVRGLANGVTISGNSFDRAVRGRCHGSSCNHNDGVQMLGGGPWTIVSNRFGDRNGGAASVYVSTASNNHRWPVHDLLVANNLFAGDGGLRAVWIGASPGGGAGMPSHVAIVNNTVLAGTDNGVYLPSAWLGKPPADRPLVANNVIAVSNGRGCAGRFVSNLIESGVGCAGSNDHGPANLDADGRPTVESTRVVDLADPAFTPALDGDGRQRVGPPDRGAFEWRGGPVDTTPPTVPGRLEQVEANQTTVDVDWQPSRDAAGVAGYRIERDGEPVGEEAGTQARVGHLACGHAYEVSIRAIDVAGNVSAPATITVRTLDCR
jgi:hypothetical protein